jgi:hypothetical protein
MAATPPTTCPSCGAPVPAGTWTCRYCHANVDPAHASIPSLAEVAGVLQGSGSSLERSLPGLVAALETALPGAVRVEREGGGLLRRGPARLRSVAATIGDHRFVLTRQGDRLVTGVEHEVRGIVLRRDTLPPGEWLARLGDQLRELAAGAQSVSPALARLLGTDRTDRAHRE